MAKSNSNETNGTRARLILGWVARNADIINHQENVQIIFHCGNGTISAEIKRRYPIVPNGNGNHQTNVLK